MASNDGIYEGPTRLSTSFAKNCSAALPCHSACAFACCELLGNGGVGLAWCSDAKAVMDAEGIVIIVMRLEQLSEQGLFAKLWVTFIILREMARLKAPLDDLHLVEFEGRGLKADEFRYLAQR
ncbi:unnamed protein product, partial [Durusdinium trenchii]